MMRLFFGMIFFFAAITVTAKSQKTIILGSTQSSLPYLSQFSPHGKIKTQKKEISFKPYQMNYAVHTKELTPDSIKSSIVDIKNLTQPIYIIGDDDLSKAWLTKYNERLKSLHAVGFIVNVKNNESYLGLSEQFNIQPIPVNGAAFKKRLGIKHYPVLISRYRIEQ